MTLPTVPIGPLEVTHLIVGGNPFSGFSHQSPERDRQMRQYYTVERIKATLRDCEQAGINTCMLRVDAHICRMLEEFTNEGGRLQWLAQMAPEEACEANINRARAFGAVGYYIHGAVTDAAYREGDLDRIRGIIDQIHSRGLLAGVAGHVPAAHLAVHEAGIATDFHMVCFYDCGSVHAGEGERFDPADPPQAVEAIRAIDKPCIAYKVLGAGRVAPEEALAYAYGHIKPVDAVNVGMFTGDRASMVADNVALAARLMATS